MGLRFTGAPVVLTLALLVSSGSARAQEVRIVDGAVEGDQVVTGTIDVPASLQATYEEATRFERWGQTLQDVREVKVLSHQRESAVVDYTSSIFVVRTRLGFTLRPPRGFDFTLLEGRGLKDVSGTMMLTPTAGGTRAVLSIRSHPTGLGRVVPSGLIRRRLHRKIEGDLLTLSRELQRKPR